MPADVSFVFFCMIRGYLLPQRGGIDARVGVVHERGIEGGGGGWRGMEYYGRIGPIFTRGSEIVHESCSDESAKKKWTDFPKSAGTMKTSGHGVDKRLK
jgi:hypothetical protein